MNKQFSNLNIYITWFPHNYKKALQENNDSTKPQIPLI